VGSELDCCFGSARHHTGISLGPALGAVLGEALAHQGDELVSSLMTHRASTKRHARPSLEMHLYRWDWHLAQHSGDALSSTCDEPGASVGSELDQHLEKRLGITLHTGPAPGVPEKHCSGRRTWLPPRHSPPPATSQGTSLGITRATAGISGTWPANATHHQHLATSSVAISGQCSDCCFGVAPNAMGDAPATVLGETLAHHQDAIRNSTRDPRFYRDRLRYVTRDALGPPRLALGPVLGDALGPVLGDWPAYPWALNLTCTGEALMRDSGRAGEATVADGTSLGEELVSN
jgi:hypothetical protein